jgi:hypothetical protein
MHDGVPSAAAASDLALIALAVRNFILAGPGSGPFNITFMFAPKPAFSPLPSDAWGGGSDNRGDVLPTTCQLVVVADAGAAGS